MLSLQRIAISALLILSVTFVFFAQSTEAAKGPKITHKVCTTAGHVGAEANASVDLGLLRHRAWR